MTITVRMYKENEVHVSDDLTQEEAEQIAIGLTIQKFEMIGIKTDELDVAILKGYN